MALPPIAPPTTPTIPSTQSNTPSSGVQGDYQVQRGDTLWSIARSLVAQQGVQPSNPAVAKMLELLKESNPHLCTAARKGGDSIFVNDPVIYPKLDGSPDGWQRTHGRSRPAAATQEDQAAAQKQMSAIGKTGASAGDVEKLKSALVSVAQALAAQPTEKKLAIARQLMGEVEKVAPELLNTSAARAIASRIGGTPSTEQTSGVDVAKFKREVAEKLAITAEAVSKAPQLSPDALQAVAQLMAKVREVAPEQLNSPAAQLLTSRLMGATSVQQAPATQTTQTPPDSTDGLSQQQRVQLQVIASGQSGAASKAALEQLVGSPAFNALDKATQTRVLDSIQPSSVRASIADLDRLVQMPVFANANEADRAQMLDLAKLGQASALATLGEKVLSTDTTGTRLLDTAHQLATGPLMPEFERDRVALLTSALTEAAEPARINQGNRGTCAPTVAAMVVARSNPAEYVRLIAGLASPGGNVAMANGESLQRDPGSEQIDDSNRTPSQRLFQAAVMEFANGSAAYDNAGDTSTKNGTVLGGGLTAGETAHAISALTGAEKRATTEGSMDDFLRGKAQGLLEGTADSFRFVDSPSDVFARLEQNPNESPAKLTWDKAEHWVVVTRIAEGRVYFHDPKGNRFPAGQVLENPPRRSEGGTDKSMAIADFRARLQTVID